VKKIKVRLRLLSHLYFCHRSALFPFSFRFEWATPRMKYGLQRTRCRQTKLPTPKEIFICDGVAHAIVFGVTVAPATGVVWRLVTRSNNDGIIKEIAVRFGSN
tara:strand:- start:137 stop:445 length:309 start_codon:yes stop_codon:yes gene_type:complete